MKTRLLIGLAGLSLLIAACGSGSTATHGDAHESSTGAVSQRTVEIEMRDIAFSPTTLDAKLGETVTFKFTNKGAIRHEALVGDDKAQEDHAMSMSAASGSEMHHDESAVTVEPGQSGEFTHTFDSKGTFIIGCHEPGHYEAGMKATVNVS